ncbi:DAN domain family member 5-like [Sinocyclocheilus rhinocerous]|uniref:DAN domain family member 5-like n=1 Tax=Sinocyclocheilus rhinocerous TaxID=307959 RepID=A0A673G6H6_9TELE|nr:PREDICTED: DAN domain family member 5-like [Sinocyclocheilus rhinocerous]
MTFQISSFILLSVVTLVGAFPRSAFPRDFHRHVAKDLEFSGNGPDEPIRGSVRVVKLSPHFLRRAAGSHVQSKNSPRRGAFPAFLALGRPGPSVLAHNKPAALLPQVSASSTSVDARRKQGLEMWQKVMHKSERSKEDVALRINPKDMIKQSCAAVPFTQRVTEDGCETVTVHNNLCYGQCSSMFVPSSGESPGQQGAQCTRCGPSKSRFVLVPLRCGTEVRENRVMVVEDCKCETSSEEVKVQNTEMFYL